MLLPREQWKLKKKVTGGNIKVENDLQLPGKNQNQGKGMYKNLTSYWFTDDWIYKYR